MKAAYYERTGPARDVLKVGELNPPVPEVGEVLVRLHASGVNPVDTKVRAGAPGRRMGHDRIVPHHDGAGCIEEVGADVSESRLGQRVWIHSAQFQRPSGTCAAFVALPQHLAIALPEQTTFEEGACLGVPVMTAWDAVLGDGPVAGKTILVSGGAGAVGHYAVQIARLSGARVLATVSNPEKAKEAISAGAHLTVNYRDRDAAEQLLDATGGRGVDHFVDVDTTGNSQLAGKVMALEGRVVSYGSAANEATMPIRDFRQNLVSFRFLLVFRLATETTRRMAAAVNGLLEAGALKHRIARRYPLHEVAEAHVAVEGGTLNGKAIIMIDDAPERA